MSLSADRFFLETGWSPDNLKGKWILDAGCGAGRFLDVASKCGANVVGVDNSNSVDAARANLAGRSGVHLVQASLYELPFRPGVFDACYCIGVVQYTPDPSRTLKILPPYLREGGLFACSAYERKAWTKLYSKYLLRPLTKRLPPRILLGMIRATMPVLFPLTEVLYRLPALGRLFKFVIPVSNYVGHNRGLAGGLSRKQRYSWAVMDTFGMLAPPHDYPQTWEEVSRALELPGSSG